jgi:predicted GIY-YIG superfamily endonuclease
MRRYWTEEEVVFLDNNYSLKGAAYCSEKLNRTNRAVRDKARKLGIKSNNSRLADNLVLRSGGYAFSLQGTDYEVLEKYITSKTPILHKHITCGYTWKTSPDNIKVIKGCPNCSLSKDINNIKTYLYFIYFSALDIYKIGVTLDWQKRKNEFAYKPELLQIEEFNTRTEALSAEYILKQKLKKYLYNSGELKNGNTETFVWPN